MVDEDSIIPHLDSLPDRGDRKELFLKYRNTPYQLVNDSPTIKHYTQWSLYDSLNLKVRQVSGERLEPPLKYERSTILHNNVLQSGVMNDELGKDRPNLEDKLSLLTLCLSKRVSVVEDGRHLVYHRTDAEGVFSPLYVELEGKENSVTEVVYISEAVGRTMNSFVIKVKVPKSSVVNLILVERDSLSYTYGKVLVENLGEANVSLLSSGANQSHVEVNTELGEGAEINFNARVIGVKDNRLDVKTTVNHLGKKSVSNGVLKGVSGDASTVTIRGIATVSETGQDSSTSIIGRGLLLNPSSRVVVTPMLEVKTGKVVMAKHSASASRVSDDMIFYLQNRGLDRRSAEGLILRGFLSEEGDLDIMRELIESRLRELGY
ncbi:SufD family Fe-S cluster assembly protein [Sulfodiicoccus acidiphilus]|uniref:SufD family Fe-S cluster assembly protein n=1 Tax=Sulfodiicoccus acidiphilus TaxID=1670455 RepID=UPI001E416576|nr:SufD family Fe-S cluster assembly protein [Sulfodiicoccus acidiphilus]